MGWQDYTVWAIGAAVAFVLAGRLRRLFCGRGRQGGCAACGQAGCPLRKIKDKR